MRVCRAYLANIITIWAYHLVPLLSAVGLQPVAFSQEFRIVSTARSSFVVQAYAAVSVERRTPNVQSTALTELLRSICSIPSHSPVLFSSSMPRWPAAPVLLSSHSCCCCCCCCCGCVQAATIYLLLTVAVQYYVREAPHFYGMWRANISNILLSWTYMKAIGRAALRKKSTFQVHACDEKAPATERLMPNPAMAEPQPRSECPLCCLACMHVC
jgi:hypothetical protein